MINRVTVYKSFIELPPDKIARFLYQVQIGLRSAASEKAWLEWLNSDLGDYDT